MTNTKTIGLSLILALAVFSAASPAGRSPPPLGKWQFEIMPYFWASGLKTDIKTGLQPEKSTEVSFSELSKLVHFGLASMFEARKDRWGFLIDGSYVDLGTTVAQSETMPGDVDVTLKNGSFSLAGLARVVEAKRPSISWPERAITI